MQSLGRSHWDVCVICFILSLRTCSGVKELQSLRIDGQVTLLDVRDYNEEDEINGAIRIPIAYFKRHYRAIPHREVVVVAHSEMEKNVAIRLLRRYHFSVQGYYIKGRKHVNALNVVKCH